MTTTVEVKGLRQSLVNLAKLASDVQKKIGRLALRDAALVVNAAVKGATYSTFSRRSGAIQSGFGVRVGNELKGTTLNAVVVEYPQSLAGLSPATRLFRRSALRQSSRARKVNLESTAFWWRFLEFGTGPRMSERTPAFQREGRLARTRGEIRAAHKFQSAAHALGAITPRSWVRPAFSSSGVQAVDVFAKTMRTETDATVQAYPK